MSTPDTNNIGIKLQAVGENLNTWGAPNLNNDFSVVSNITSGFNPITINGDYNVAANETNYATNNPSEYATLKLVAGTVAAAFNFIWANRPKRTLVWNATAFAAQMKLTASTGFSLPAGATAWIATDGATDVYNTSPSLIPASAVILGPLTIAGQLHGVVAGTVPTDGVNKTQMETAIANASFPASAGTVLISGTDTTAGYLAQKITLNGAVIAPTNPGGNEAINIVIDEGQLSLIAGVYAL